MLRKRLTSKCSSWRIRKQLRRRLSPHKNAHSASLQEIEEIVVSWTRRRGAAQQAAATGIVREMP